MKHEVFRRREVVIKYMRINRFVGIRIKLVQIRYYQKTIDGAWKNRKTLVTRIRPIRQTIEIIETDDFSCPFGTYYSRSFGENVSDVEPSVRLWLQRVKGFDSPLIDEIMEESLNLQSQLYHRFVSQPNYTSGGSYGNQSG